MAAAVQPNGLWNKLPPQTVELCYVLTVCLVLHQKTKRKISSVPCNNEKKTDSFFYRNIPVNMTNQGKRVIMINDPMTA